MRKFTLLAQWLFGLFFLSVVGIVLLAIPLGHPILAYHLGGQLGVTALKNQTKGRHPVALYLGACFISILLNVWLWSDVVAFPGIFLVGMGTVAALWSGFVRETRDKRLKFTGV